jgi:FKBP-type peptidyl-prolyl cis-trans isomerase
MGRGVVLTCAVMMVSAFALNSCDKVGKNDGKLELKTDRDKLSYCIGTQIGNQVGMGLKKDSIDVNIDILVRAFKEAYLETPPILTEDEMKQVFDKFSADREAAQTKKMADNQKNASAFIIENAKKPGIKTLPDSIQYEVMQAGTGPKPKPTDKVKVNYRGTLLDGTEFDSSYKRGTPTEFTVNRMIPGWVEVLPMMPVGSKWKIYIPPKLGYGERGAGTIPPNALLIFEIELLEIVK